MIYPFTTLEELETMIEGTRNLINPKAQYRDLMILDNVQSMDDVLNIVRALNVIVKKYALHGVTPESVIYPCQVTGTIKHMINLKVAR